MPAARMFRRFRNIAMKGKPLPSISSSHACFVLPLLASFVWKVSGSASRSLVPACATSNSPGSPDSPNSSSVIGYFFPRTFITSSFGAQMWQRRTRPFMERTTPHSFWSAPLRPSSATSPSSARTRLLAAPALPAALPPCSASRAPPLWAAELHRPSRPSLSFFLCLASWYSLKSANFFAKAVRSALGSLNAISAPHSPVVLLLATRCEMLILATSCMSVGNFKRCPKYVSICSLDPLVSAAMAAR
mmetsp:Transcript_32582/g.93440  ORF Transcript_32582/g.93440 Transcript_32582/m.93440 type:complete len:246 (-) Transcript_32582:1097-1834(-)